MDLTPKTSTPWWKLLGCCKEASGDDHIPAEAEEDKLNAEKDTSTECTEDVSEHSNQISLENSKLSKESSCVTEEQSDEPKLVTIEEDGDDVSAYDSSVVDNVIEQNDVSDTVPSTSDEISCKKLPQTIDMGFWKFFAFMMLRNTLGLDYVSEIVREESDMPLIMPEKEEEIGADQ